MRDWLIGFALTAVAACCAQPNIVVLLADDQGWGDLGYHGHPTIRTPALDSLAHDGAHFERFYVQPVCAPTRAEFLTGRQAPRTGVIDVSEGAERLALREHTIADVFRAAGYATGCFGKWHNGSQHPYHPNTRGFDEFYGFTSGHWGSYFDATMDHNGELVTGSGYLADDITDHTLAFMAAQTEAGRPFLAYLAFNTPHAPMQVPDANWNDWADRDIPAEHRYSAREEREHTRAALAMVENLDANAGRVLAELERLGIADNTIVVYFTDNGPNGWRWNGDLKGRKASTDEGGVRSPLFVRWPGHIPPRTTVTPLASAVDLLPTLAELAAVDLHPPLPLDGASYAAVLTGTGDAPAPRPVFTSWRGAVSVRTQRFMLDAKGNLYDLAADIRQTEVVTDQHPAVAARLQQVVAAWREDIAATAAPAIPAIPVGHPAAAVTYLPARDAVLHGGLKRSNQYPNDSYVLNWRSTVDKLTWDIEVIEPDRFAVTIHYTARTPGAMLELTMNDAKSSGRIPTAWDPLETGMEHDRVPRAESYVKDFRAFSLGEIDLHRGPGKLTLTAPNFPGETALDFKRISLRRVN
ncbi:arylsulfatase [Synoicihabitans lomoniglobus]|uniref:Arylsulfatase n=1 Tax=Synoicihabitans lomoniglobus TaxID=2909285 RepID=A0AAF0CR61_9BACT|nr:arylsulfatase [Opitutaceae bacterium LMO-M01]WED66548.1 arylsulfatase [Opitutaceae bacterium LMO-M01]